MSTPDLPPSHSKPRGARLGPRLALVGLAASGIYLYLTRSSKPFHNGAVSNIEKAYSAGGATPTHTPAYGGTPRGKPDDTSLRQDGSAGGKQEFDASGMEQRGGDRNVGKRKWDDMKYGKEEGK